MAGSEIKIPEVVPLPAYSPPNNEQLPEILAHVQQKLQITEMQLKRSEQYNRELEQKFYHTKQQLQSTTQKLQSTKQNLKKKKSVIKAGNSLDYYETSMNYQNYLLERYRKQIAYICINQGNPSKLLMDYDKLDPLISWDDFVLMN